MNRHGIDRLSLGFGLVFLSVAAWWLLAVLVDVALPRLAWFAAGTLIVLGLLGLFATVRSEMGARRPE